jgi:periplasmic protein CpxP/Spy
MTIQFDRLAAAAAAAVLGACLLAAPLSATAQPASPAPAQAAPAPAAAAPAPATAAPKATHRKRAPVDRIEARITSLHTQLKLTADQETQWQAVAQVMRDNAHKLDQLVHARSDKRATMSAVDNLTTYEAIVDAHADGLKQLVPAFQALYATLSDAQKKNADAVFNQTSRTRRAAKKAG